jgi:hypothetical protein
MILLERAPAAVRNQTNDGGFSAYVLPLGNVEKNNGRAPWGDAAQALPNLLAHFLVAHGIGWSFWANSVKSGKVLLKQQSMT